MISVRLDEYQITINEPVGLKHDRQLICVAMPKTAGDFFLLTDSTGKRKCFLARSLQNPNTGFLSLEIQPFDNLNYSNLTPIDIAGNGLCTTKQTDKQIEISNGRYSILCPYGNNINWTGIGSAPSPVLAYNTGSGWRGNGYLDTSLKPHRICTTLIENNPLRVVLEYNVEFENNNFYHALVTVDAHLPFAAIKEDFRTNAGDQVVFYLDGEHKPTGALLLDGSGGYTHIDLRYHLDQCHARLACFSQYSQLAPFSDGFAVCDTATNETVGIVALNSGDWHGNRLNQIDGYSRRWDKNDITTRKLLPPEAKADSAPSPDHILARGQGLYKPAFCFEGYIGNGSREYALVFSNIDDIMPPCISYEQLAAGKDIPNPLSHFEDTPDMERYFAHQSLLRKIHTQFGIMPLSKQIGMCLDWQTEDFSNTCESTDKILPSDTLLDYLHARVYGFWFGSGLPYSNCVVGRKIAPYMQSFATYANENTFTSQESKHIRSLFSFLCYFYETDAHYPGKSTMAPVDTPDSLDPFYLGMPNQNFYTDIINVFGTGGVIFENHPQSTVWVSKFIEMWHLQLRYHMYPNSGVWEESVTYYQHILSTVYPTFLMLKQKGIHDEFAEPDFVKFVSFATKILSTQDIRYNGRRYLLPYGDHGVDICPEYRDTFARLAKTFMGSEPALAQQLYYMHKEMHGQIELDVIPQATPIESENIEGLGFIFRANDGTNETLFSLRSGGAWGHHHADEGGILFYAKNRSMITDICGGAIPSEGHRKFSDNGHSRLIIDNIKTINHLARFNRGCITSCDINGKFPYATATIPVILDGSCSDLPALRPLKNPFDCTRTVVALTPCAYLVIDKSSLPIDSQVIFHVPKIMQVENNGTTFSDNDGTALHIHCLLPEKLTPLISVNNEKEYNPQKPGFATHEVRYRLGRNSLAMFLILATDPNETYQLSRKDDSFKLILGDKTIDFDKTGCFL